MKFISQISFLLKYITVTTCGIYVEKPIVIYQAYKLAMPRFISNINVPSLSKIHEYNCKIEFELNIM